MSKEWLKCASIRAFKTFCQTAVSLIAVGSTVSQVDWMNVLSVSFVSSVLSLLTSMAGLPEVSEDGTTDSH